MKVKVSRTSTGTDVYIDDVRLETGSPMFTSKLISNYVIGSSVTSFDLVFDTEIQDRGSWYDNSTGIATAPVSGDYLITATVHMFTTNNTEDWDMYLDVNGSAVYQFGKVDTQHYGSASETGHGQLNIVYPLLSGDQFKILIKRTGTATKTGNTVRAIGSTFAAKLMR